MKTVYSDYIKKGYQCEFCKKKFDRPGFLKSHLKFCKRNPESSVHKKMVEERKQKRYDAVNRYKKRIRQARKHVKMRRVYNRRYWKKYKVKKKLNPPIFECSFCNKKLKSMWFLNKHLEKCLSNPNHKPIIEYDVGDPKNLTCRFCGRDFALLLHRTRHEKHCKSSPYVFEGIKVEERKLVDSLVDLPEGYNNFYLKLLDPRHFAVIYAGFLKYKNRNEQVATVVGLLKSSHLVRKLLNFNLHSWEDISGYKYDKQWEIYKQNRIKTININWNTFITSCGYVCDNLSSLDKLDKDVQKFLLFYDFAKTKTKIVKEQKGKFIIYPPKP